MNNTVVSKIRVKHPNKPGTKNSNAEYCKYIATRSGVWTIQDTLMSDDPNYAAYISKRPNSHGLFGNINVNSLSNTCNYIKHKSEAGNLIYRGILSLDKEDAADLGYLTQRKWINLLNETMSSIAAEFHIPIENLEWVGAFHFEKDHPHVHYMFWNKEQQIASPFIHTSKQQRCREIFSKEIYKDERALYIQEKTATRDLILEFGKDVMSQSKSFIQDLSQLDKERKTPDKIYSKEISILSKSLIMLANDLPEQGKMAYSYMPHDIKEEICVITDSLFNRVDMRKELMNYLAATENISRSYSTTELKQYIQKSNAYKDLQKRLGNIIIKSALSIKQYQKEVNIPFEFYNSLFNSFDLNLVEKLEPININDNFNQYVSELSDKMVSEFDELYYTNNSKEYQKPNFLSTNFSYSSSEEASYTNFLTNEYKKAKILLYGNKKIKPDTIAALSLINEEARKGNPLALYDLGTFYEKGNLTNLDKNIDKANTYYNSAFNILKNVSEKEPNNYYVHYKLGKLYQYGIGTNINLKKAYNLFTISAKANKSSAQYSLAKMYLTGDGVEQNSDKALNYFLSSTNDCKRANPFSCYELGKMYEKGIGTDIDLSKSQAYYKTTLDSFLHFLQAKEDDQLLYQIGFMYYHGQGTEKNTEKAIEYLKKSINHKNSNAMYLLAKIYIENGTKNYDEIINLLKNSAKKNNHFALYELGKLYSNNSDILNMQKSLSYFNKAAAQGNSYAQFTLGKLYANKENSFYNIHTSVSYLKDSAKQNNLLAQIELYKVCLDKSLPYYDPKVIDELKNLSENGSDIAQCTLGYTYLFNKEFKNKAAAIYWLKKAAAQGNKYAKNILQQDKEITKAFIQHQAFKTFLNIFDSMVSYNHEDEKNSSKFISKQAIKDYLKKQGNNLEKD